MQFPASYAELTPDFLSKALGTSVEGFEVDNSMTASGVLADAYRVFNISYVNGGDGPKSLFIKSTKTIPEIVELCKATGIYAKEIYFYKVLTQKISDVIRVPECLAIYTDSDDETRFCIVMEDFTADEWMPFDLMTNPMTYKDMSDFMIELAKLHAHCWHEPVSDQPGLGVFRAHWQSLNDDFVKEDGANNWDLLLPEWESVYGSSLLSEVDSEVRESIQRISEIIRADTWPGIQDRILLDLQSRPRTITHGDARGNNIFRSRKDGSISFIDWQMWVAGPPCSEFPQIWLSSFSGESGMVDHLEDLTRQYYDALTKIRPEISDDYSFGTMMTDTRLCFINMWVQYIGFSLDSVAGYSDPAQAEAKENWRIMMGRNMETLHGSKALQALEAYIG
jgi:hypothetical protein